MIKKTMLTMLALSIWNFSASAQNLKGFDKSNMDTSVKPGTDFVQYSTGTWLKSHPLDNEHVTNGAFSDLYDQNQLQIQELILQFANTPQQRGTLGYKIGTLYNLMMDSVRLNKEGFNPIKANLEKIKAIKDRKEYQRVTAELDRKGESTMMYAWGVGADQRNAGNNIVAISQAGLGLGTPEYYLNEDPQSKAVVGAYKTYLTKLFQLVGYDAETAAKKVEAVMEIENRIAKVSYDQVKRRDINANYHKLTYAELIEQYPGIDWPTVFWVSGFPVFNEVDLGQPEPIHEVEKILADTDLDNLKSYAEIRIIAGASSCMSDEFRKAQFEFSQTLSGQPADLPRWKRANSLVNSVLSDAIGQMYCEKYFPASSKKRMLEIVGNLQTALAQRISEATWMSEPTKAQAKDKLEHFIVKIGYPDKWKDYTNLVINDSLSLYENLANIKEYFWIDDLNRKVGKPVDKTEWLMSPQTINAYYNPTTNEICFPAGILQPPFFDPESDDAINYGAIGAVIGHEMTHGFDDQGCQFDKTGNQRNWWTEADKTAYDKRTKVLEDYFSNIEVVNGKKINGKQTLGENIGDNGGLNVALRAMHNAGTAAAEIDGLKADQRFFLGWARIWASNNRPEYMDMLLTNDVHSPNIARVNGALPHIDEWYTAFGIKKSDKLYIPKNKRAHIW